MMYSSPICRSPDWVSSVDALPAFYWATYVAIWLVPAAGLWMAMRDRQRLLLDVNILLAIVTLMSNKQYLGAEQMPWDPILFGVLLVGVALGLRRWLSSGPNGSRQGVVAERLLASERAVSRRRIRRRVCAWRAGAYQSCRFGPGHWWRRPLRWRGRRG